MTIIADASTRTKDKRAVLSDRQFSDLTSLIAQKSGLYFTEEKRREFQIKLAEILKDSKGKSRGDDLIRAIKESDQELEQLLNMLTIGESYFFRNRPHFEALTEKIFPELIEEAKTRKTLRIWCAGCATGEEPYSVSILLRDKFPEIANWNIIITATDINTRFLKKAREGVYTKWSFRGVDDDLIWRYFTKEAENKYRLHADIRRTVNFKWFNLADMPFVGRLPVPEYDLIMCRNVLIYFAFQFANEVVASFGDLAHPGTYLLVGHSEAFPALSQMDVIYSHATYYYRYHKDPGERADRQSIAPAPTLSIPGIGVKTVVPLSPVPDEQGRPVFQAGAVRIVEEKPPQKRMPPKRPSRRGLNITSELEQARRLANQGKVNDAFNRLSILAEGQGNLDYRVHFLRAIIADQAGHVQEAMKSLKQAIFLNKNFVIGHFYLGVINQREGKIKNASRSFRNARNLVDKLSPDHLLDEAEGLTAGRLREIVDARFEEIKLE